MIQMPQRSVTRFFIPMIDVLLLLFCIFLLMPMATEEAKVKEEKELKGEKERLSERLKEMEKLKPDLAKMADLMLKIKELEAWKARPLEKLFVRGIDVDAEGNMVFRQGFSRDKPYTITSKDDARALIKVHQDQAGGREVYYLFFLEWKGAVGVDLISKTADWFKGVSYTFEVEKKLP